MKVLHVIDSLATGGAEKLILDTIPIFNRKGLKVDLALLNGKESPFYKILESLNCCKIYQLSFGTLYNPILIFKLIPIIRNYDIVHVHLFPAQYWVVIAKILSFSKCKLIFTEHSTDNRRINNILLKRIDMIVYKFYNKIICISDDVKEILYRKIKIRDAKLLIINNGIDINNISNQKSYNREQFGFNKDDFLIVMVAAFRKEKNHIDLIYSLKKLDSKYKLVLVGGGSEKENIIKLVNKLNLTNRVLFTGITTEVPRFIKMCNIGVLSSHWEGFGLSAIETMACGLPIIVSKVPGISKVIGSSALYFENGDVNDLVLKIKLLTDKDIYTDFQNRGKNKARFYDIETTILNTIKLYNELLNNRK